MLLKHDIIFRYTFGAVILGGNFVMTELYKFTVIGFIMDWLYKAADIDIIGILWKWLRKEAMLLLMQIDYL